jgi:hypothetical protein
MRSFARVVQLYARRRGGNSNPDDRAIYAQEAAADLQELFGCHLWPFFERSYDVDLWGTETADVASVSGTLVTLETGSIPDKWVGQQILIPGSTSGAPYTIQRVNTSASFLIDPAYDGSTVASGTDCTVEQVVVTLPVNFHAVIDDIVIDGHRSRAASIQEVLESQRYWGASDRTYVHAIRGDQLLLGSPHSGRLWFRYRETRDNLYQYDVGRAKVQSDAPLHVEGFGSPLWSALPTSGTDAVFESKDSIARGYPYSAAILLIDNDTNIVLKNEWSTPLDSLFDYVISTDLNLPPYMDAVMQAMADRRAGLVGDDAVARARMRARSNSSQSDAPIGDRRPPWPVAPLRVIRPTYT